MFFFFFFLFDVTIKKGKKRKKSCSRFLFSLGFFSFFLFANLYLLHVTNV